MNSTTDQADAEGGRTDLVWYRQGSGAVFWKLGVLISGT